MNITDICNRCYSLMSHIGDFLEAESQSLFAFLVVTLDENTISQRIYETEGELRRLHVELRHFCQDIQKTQPVDFLEERTLFVAHHDATVAMEEIIQTLKYVEGLRNPLLRVLMLSEAVHEILL